MGKQQLKVVSFKRWYKFVKAYPKLDGLLEEAIVKDIDDGHYLVDVCILREILKNNGQNPTFEL